MGICVTVDTVPTKYSFLLDRTQAVENLPLYFSSALTKKGPRHGGWPQRYFFGAESRRCLYTQYATINMTCIPTNMKMIKPSLGAEPVMTEKS